MSDSNSVAAPPIPCSVRLVVDFAADVDNARCLAMGMAMQWLQCLDGLQLGHQDQIRQRRLHRLGDADRRDQPDVLAAALDAGHVGAVDGRAMRQLFLRDAELGARAPHGLAEGNEHGILGMAR